MIDVTFFIASDGCICGFEVSGHAGFGVIGKDIVCAAVSSAVYLVVNTITDVMNIRPLTLSLKSGMLSVLISGSDAIECGYLLKGLCVHLTGVSEQYRKSLVIKYRSLE